jgi:hypothetical protein
VALHGKSISGTDVPNYQTTFSALPLLVLVEHILLEFKASGQLQVGGEDFHESAKFSGVGWWSGG